MTATCPAATYLARPAEALVVRGYRLWLTGSAFEEPRAFSEALDLYIDELGEEDGRRALLLLTEFLATLGRCAACPLRFCPEGAGHACRDECLVLALVAAIQNGDEDAERIAAEALACARRGCEVAVAAASFALTLRGLGRRLLPIPSPAIADIVARAEMAGRGARTVH